MDNIQKKSLEAFDEMLKSIDKKELNNLIEQISNIESGSDPTIEEYFNLMEEQFAHFYFCEDIVDDSSKSSLSHYQYYKNILNTSYNKVIEKEFIIRSFNVLLNQQDANGLFDASLESNKSMRKTSLAA
ncbi:MAG: hypothetical protein PHN55_11245 [Dysgonamonadaceae bacterium]|nr:hypothetical protein [Dysgonamonadaceae bacterium]